MVGIKKQIMYFFVLAVLGNLLYSSFPGKNLTFRHLSIGDGLSQSIVNCILQDSNGFMWFGTYNGLNKYDGRQFTVYQHSDRKPGSLSNNVVQSLYEDQDGVLWVGTEGGLNRFDPKSETFTHFRNDPRDPTSLSHDFVEVLYEDRKGILWVGTLRGGLNKFNRKKGTFTRFEKSNGRLSSNTIMCLFADHHGFLWIGTGNGLYRFDREKETLTHFLNTDTHWPNNSTNRIRSFLEDRRGHYWAGIESGLYRFSPGTGIFNLVELGDKTDSTNRRLVIMSLYEAPDGIIWVGTIKNGLFLLDPVTLQSDHCRFKLNSPGKLNHSQISCIYEDSSGLIWLGTAGGGLNIYNDRESGFYHFQGTPGKTNCLNNNSIWAIREDSQGVLWIGTGGGGVNCINRRTGKYTFYKEKKNDSSSLSHNYVQSICRDHRGVMWIGTLGGVSRFNRERNNFTRFSSKQGGPPKLSNNRVSRISEDRDRVLWVATLGGLNRFNRQDETFSSFRHEPGNNRSLSSDHINEIYQGRKGALWIGTENGLNKFNKEDESFTRFTAAPGCTNCLSANDVRAIHEDGAGIIWIGTNNGGLNRFNPGDGTFRSYGIEDGLPGNTIYCILEDDQKNLWLSTSRGISRFTPATGYFCNFDAHDGLRSYEYNSRAGYKSPEGEIFLGGLYGFVSFFPDQIQVNRYVPPVVITGIDIIDSTNGSGDNRGKVYYPGKKEIELSYKDRIFVVNFAALDYSQPGKNQYKYKLEGFTSKWIPLGTTPEVTFSNLSPGRYVFRVRGSNSNGIWNNDGAALTIFIEPPFWKTWWFKFLCLVLVVLLFYSWHRWRMKSFTLKLQTEEEMAFLLKKYNISNREKEVITLVLKGKSNKQIEDELFISPKTVTSHIYNIYKKLEVKNRVEMIRKVKGVL